MNGNITVLRSLKVLNQSYPTRHNNVIIKSNSQLCATRNKTKSPNKSANYKPYFTYTVQYTTIMLCMNCVKNWAVSVCVCA